jgi:hypothetical protein
MTGDDAAITILDLRPKMNAQANMMMGGGFESTKNYKNTVREFHPIVRVIFFALTPLLGIWEILFFFPLNVRNSSKRGGNHFREIWRNEISGH